MQASSLICIVFKGSLYLLLVTPLCRHHWSVAKVFINAKTKEIFFSKTPTHYWVCVCCSCFSACFSKNQNQSLPCTPYYINQSPEIRRLCPNWTYKVYAEQISTYQVFGEQQVPSPQVSQLASGAGSFLKSGILEIREDQDWSKLVLLIAFFVHGIVAGLNRLTNITNWG